MSDELIISAGAHKGPVCGCLTRLRAHMLRNDENGMPATDYRSGAAVIFTRRCNPVGRFPPMILASFCPFCGDAYA